MSPEPRFPARRPTTRRRLVLMSLLTAALLLFPDLGPRPAAADDPRFFGSFCGEHTERYVVEVRFLGIPISRRTETQNFQIRTRITTIDRGSAGTLVAGSGSAIGQGGRADGTIVPFTLNGRSRRTGVVEGFLQSQSLGRTSGTATLSTDGDRLQVLGLGRRLQLSRGACGDNRSPQVEILAPSPWTFPWGEALELRARASDAEDGALPNGRVRWTSDRDGDLGSGYELTTPFLSRGEHLLTATATDSRGALGRATVRVIIANNAPNAPVILTPANGSEIIAGSAVVLRGRATDRDSGQLVGEALQWRTSVSGALGSGELVWTSLVPGLHQITLEARDPDGGSSRAVIQVTVRPPVDGENRPPSVAILSPRDFVGLSDTDCIVLMAEARDPEDPIFFPGAFTWTDTYFDGTRDLTRTLPDTGPRVEICGLPAPSRDTVHRIEVRVTDSGGTLSAPDAVRLYVIPGGLI